MSSLQDEKTCEEILESGLYDDLIIFSYPSLVPPTFAIEAEMSSPLYEGNAHIVPMPAWSTFVGVSKFLVAFVTLVLTALVAGIWGNFPAFGITLFICVATLVIGGYYGLALGYKPLLYNRWAILGLEAFGVIFWLVSCILLAEWTATYDSSVYWGKNYLAYLPYNFIHGHKRALLIRTSADQHHAGVILAAIATALAGIELIFFTITLAAFSINMHQHRKAGYPALYGGPQMGSVATTTAALDEMEKARD